MRLSRLIHAAEMFTRLVYRVVLFPKNGTCYLEVWREQKDHYSCVVISVHDCMGNVVFECGDITDDGYAEEREKYGIDLDSEDWRMDSTDIHNVGVIIKGFQDELNEVKEARNA